AVRFAAVAPTVGCTTAVQVQPTPLQKATSPLVPLVPTAQSPAKAWVVGSTKPRTSFRRVVFVIWVGALHVRLSVVDHTAPVLLLVPAAHTWVASEAHTPHTAVVPAWVSVIGAPQELVVAL